jgi:hypothetical protein
MGKQSRRERRAGSSHDERPTRACSPGLRFLQMLVVAFVVAVGIAVAFRSRVGPADSSGNASFTRVGRNGPVFTISVPRARVADDQYLLRVAEQLSAEEVQAGGSGQISVMIWPDDAAVPKEPPSTEFDASMKTQAAGIFINPKRNIQHMIRFKDGATVAEQEFGNPPR